MKFTGEHNHLRSIRREDGNILFTSLLLLLAMNFLGLALLQTAQREYQTADFKTIDSSTFNFAESCTEDTIKWFKAQNRPPTTLPYTITKTDVSHLYDTSESVDNKAKLSGYSYNCTTDFILVKSTSGSQTGSGEDIGNSSGYGAAGDLRPDYYYQVVANSAGPKNSTKKLTTVIAVKY